jgi:hypothetical protein
MGRHFELGLLARALDIEPAALLGALESAVRNGLVAGEPPSRFRFTHDLLQEAAYELLPTATRAGYHDRIARALLELRDGDAMMGEIAFHLHRALPLSDIPLTVRCARRPPPCTPTRMPRRNTAGRSMRWSWTRRPAPGKRPSCGSR